MSNKPKPKLVTGHVNGTLVQFKRSSDIMIYGKPWHCSQCGKRYTRRNAFTMWLPSLIGTTRIYHPVRARLCLECSKPRNQALLRLVGPQ